MDLLCTKYKGKLVAYFPMLGLAWIKSGTNYYYHAGHGTAGK